MPQLADDHAGRRTPVIGLSSGWALTHGFISGNPSRARLPAAWIATGVEAGDDRDLVVVDGEVQGVWKAIEHPRASDAIAPHDREAERILGDAEHRAVERPSKATAKRRGAFGVPVLGLDDVVTSISGEGDLQGQRRSSSPRS